MIERRAEVERRVPSKLWPVARQCKKLNVAITQMLMYHRASHIPRLYCPGLSHTKLWKRIFLQNCKTNSRVESLGIEATQEQSQEKLLLKSLVEVVSYGAGEGNHRWLVCRRERQGAHSIQALQHEERRYN